MKNLEKLKSDYFNNVYGIYYIIIELWMISLVIPAFNLCKTSKYWSIFSIWQGKRPSLKETKQCCTFMKNMEPFPKEIWSIKTTDMTEALETLSKMKWLLQIKLTSRKSLWYRISIHIWPCSLIWEKMN